MKKRFLSLSMMFVMMVTSLVFLTGCSNVTNFSSANVSGQGGITVVSGDYLYYISKGSTDRTLSGDALAGFGIYKTKIDADGLPTGEATLVYEGLVGHKNSSLYVFGDYIYFTTPSRKRNSSGEYLTDRTSFCRVRTDGKDYELLHTTDTKDALKYAYYQENDEQLYLLVNEGALLYSIDLASKKFDRTTISEEVVSVVFSKTCGNGSNADKFVFFTEEPAKNYATNLGHNVYKASPSGENVENISSGENVSLIEIKDGYLYFSIDKYIYRTTTVGGLTTHQEVSYGTYDSYIITNDGGILLVNTDEKETWYFNWTTGTMKENCVLGTSDYNILVENGDYVYAKYTDNLVYKFSLSQTRQTPVKVTEKVASGMADDLTIEIVGNTIYYYTEVKVSDEVGKEVSNYTLNWKKI